jgi:ribosomal protein L40E
METTTEKQIIYICERCGAHYENEVETCEICLCEDLQALETEVKL